MVRRSRKEAVGSEELERAKCRSKYKQTEMGQCSSSKNIKSSPQSLIRQRKLLLLNVFYELLLNMQIVNVSKLCVEGRQPWALFVQDAIFTMAGRPSWLPLSMVHVQACMTVTLAIELTVHAFIDSQAICHNLIPCPSDISPQGKTLAAIYVLIHPTLIGSVLVICVNEEVRQNYT